MARVLFEGEEVACVAAFIARIMPLLTGPDFEIADIMLEKALAGMDGTVAPDVIADLNRLRTPPGLRFGNGSGVAGS